MFLYIRGDIRRVLPPYISINNQGHTASNTEAFHAYCNDHDNIITIWSSKNVLCNYYSCELRVNGQTFRSSEYTFQWKFRSHVKCLSLYFVYTIVCYTCNIVCLVCLPYLITRAIYSLVL